MSEGRTLKRSAISRSTATAPPDATTCPSPEERRDRSCPATFRPATANTHPAHRFCQPAPRNAASAGRSRRESACAQARSRTESHGFSVRLGSRRHRSAKKKSRPQPPRQLHWLVLEATRAKRDGAIQDATVTVISASATSSSSKMNFPRSPVNRNLYARLRPRVARRFARGHGVDALDRLAQ